MVNNSFLPVGTVLHGTYRIDGHIASGGFGNTYKVTHLELEKTMAVKEFFIKGINQRDEDSTTVSVSNSDNCEMFEQQREKFKKEAKRLWSLNNPHIVKVHDLFEENGTVYYVMDFIDGESLAARQKRTGKHMAEAKVLKVVRQVLDALKCIHAHKLYHLDLKPANIMVDKNGVAKLIDFGASKLLDEQSAATSTAVSFTNGYAPREQLERNQAKFGPWTDLYALGATMYNLLTNQKPPLPSDIDDDESADKREALPMAHVGEGTRRIVLWMLNTNMRKRPQNVEEVLDKLQSTKQVSSTNSKTNNRFVQSAMRISASTEDRGNDENLPEWLKEKISTAEAGNRMSQNSLGDYYYNQREYVKALNWYRKAADQGFPEAFYNIGICYEMGFGVAKNVNTAKSWFKKAAEKGHQRALDKLKTKHKTEQVKTSFQSRHFEATSVRKDSSEETQVQQSNGRTDANYQLKKGDECYDKWEFNQALNWYRKAAARGNAEAEYKIGYLYKKGLGVQPDNKTAKYWFELAKQHGYKNFSSEASTNTSHHSESNFGNILLTIGKWIAIGVGCCLLGLLKHGGKAIKKSIPEIEKVAPKAGYRALKELQRNDNTFNYNDSI